ncbi:sugar phosphate nucleotidyltransferase [Borrelia miyamotoi]|uniref:UTP--glucose-1-phosphate uridylyltransferase n=1 Tax=Borrelia miyamotoi TaxID=47466 RepID=A0AAQ2WV99_9SPIR|nr:sugar phosphate nucleotidyltransferase [Borrelia miyamotoi]AGT27202.1 nucleotidyltransferase [Borrelia miyamotoi LB-2001]AJA58390.1 nucleotidyltransferase [Borrelia miyamotoi]AOW95467.1 nucleotidyltransferase [Borrelia miyamotoi]QTL83353.1 UTP--glucose-1-phosphate uridylyltransferase [Borrelia miyamotoi]WAZ85352.1 UTP--glucose-1-phosphate uridylyltransferase [Borrelia miyamotoi]
MKGIILAAGYGTRFLPITKTIPKEMLPILNKPSIDYIIEEFTSSGINEILIITSRRKGVLDNYFDREVELETAFTKEYKKDLLEKIKIKDINISFIKQKEMMGTGHALLHAKPWIRTETVIVAYPDDLHIGNPSLTTQLIELHKKTGKNILSVIENPKDINRYGVVELHKDNIHVKNIVEKPKIGKEPSNKASIGRFLYTNEFFQYLEEGFKLHKKGEYHHIYALQKLMAENKVLYKKVEGERLDIGDVGGYLESIIKVAKRDDKLLQIIKESLKD